MNAIPVLIDVIVALVIIAAGLLDRHAQSAAWSRIADARRSLHDHAEPHGPGRRTVRT